MRIIAGRLKGRRLQGPPREGVRPTSDRLRETLFNVIATRVSNARVLDGFAGTGALGLEALSRGATHVTFVEHNPHALRVLRANVGTCGVENACAIIRGDFIGLAAHVAERGTFDLVLLDPPYDFRQVSEVLTEAATLLAQNGLVVLEHSRRRADVPADAATLRRRRTLTAGDSALAFYGRPDEE
ncbi:MAG: 16S rRNA (guanine(966)-N(2))-methyltransferase RsmD [Vicinamibacterales bacterium]